MDLVGFEEAVFDRIVAEYGDFAREVGIEAFAAIPLSGLTGDNVTTRSITMPWYPGPALVEHLETVAVDVRADVAEPFRMAVQWVNRPNQSFRGYAGMIASGRVQVGQQVSVLPAGRRSKVARIVTFDGDLDEAVAGQSVTLTLTDEVDCSRGDLIASSPAPAVNRLEATLVWMSNEPLAPQRSYWLKSGTQTLSATPSTVGPVVDINTMRRNQAVTLGLNDIGTIELDLDRRVPAVRYAESRQLGGFILIDKLTHATVAAGMVQDFPAGNAREGGRVTAAEIVWFGGISAAGRAAAALRAQERLRALGRPSFILNEAALFNLNNDLAPDARAEQLRRLREVATLMCQAGIHVLVTAQVTAADARPGRWIEADADFAAVEEWVI
jgi:bifunctional enzyme CysN/CysC